MLRSFHAQVGVALVVAVSFASACGTPVKPAVLVASAPPATTVVKPEVCDEGDPYRPRAAPTAPQPNLPPVPELPDVPVKIGADYTVAGAVRRLQSRYHAADFANDVTLVGVIVATNLASAPACAIHRVGKRDPERCMSEIPSFTIADDAQAAARIRVLGWASNFATVFEAITLAQSVTSAPIRPYRDERWAVDVPTPLPAVGAKVRVHGRYGLTFTKSSTGMVADPESGVFTVTSVDTIVPATTPAKLGR